MTPLQTFYEKLTKEDNAPPFSELSDAQKAPFEKSFGFAAFKASLAFKEFAAAVKGMIPKRKARVVRHKQR